MKSKILILTSIAGIALALSLSAQDANVIPFHGQLANQSGEPLTPTSPSTLVFRLYRQAVGGIAIWEESQPNISGNGTSTTLGLNDNTADGQANPSVYVTLLRNDITAIGSRHYAFNNSAGIGYLGVSPEFLTLDFPPAGAATYKITLDAFGRGNFGL